MGCYNTQIIDNSQNKRFSFKYDQEQILGDKRTFVELDQDSSLPTDIQIEENDLVFIKNLQIHLIILISVGMTLIFLMIAKYFKKLLKKLM